ncbi:MAG: hypothetical protein AAF986_09210 [Pseudomonadota bacterium]
MLNIRQISFIDYPNLIGTARLGINVSPEMIAKKLGMNIETSFDELGAFSFLGIAAGDVILGLRRYSQKDDEYSYISTLNTTPTVVSERIKEILPSFEIEFSEFDEDW